MPSWNDFVAHPNYDAFWKRQAVAPYLTRVTVPTLNVAGWWDQEDFYGPVKIYETLEKKDTRAESVLVVGPWNHGGWAGGEGSSLGRIDFGSPTARHYREEIEAPFFACHLKDRCANAPARGLFLRDREQRVAPVRLLAASDVFPEEPLPAREGRALVHRTAPPRAKRPTLGLRSREPRALSSAPHRADLSRCGPAGLARPGSSRISASWPDDPMSSASRPSPWPQDLTVTGNLTARLFASTTGSDADWIVKLIDVYPESWPADVSMGGFQLMVSNDVLRGRFRQSFETPSPIEPGKVLEYAVDLHALDHRFLKGHRIMVQVQSTWFPVIDRNPQTFVPNIFEAKDADYKAATHKVHRSKQYPSRIELPVPAP